ncbi:MAG: fatty acid cis/trans isomerase [Hahellaceae bacterium]|nr:fatty acid cis/trans isomerase [Hahellaceae bacterium]MCP5210416.1 fatty acid cis/trans isomerase [Hahellaceae bacterium]
MASNPFLVLHQLRVKARYCFMLEEAEYTIKGFIKGSVCRGISQPLI